jgi:hypothetical protein
MIGILMADVLLVLELENFWCSVFVAQSVHIDVELLVNTPGAAIGRVDRMCCNAARLIVMCQVIDK